MNLIAIVQQHLWLVTWLNAGEAPEIEEEVTFYLHDPGSRNRILTADQARALFPDDHEYINRFAY